MKAGYKVSKKDLRAVNDALSKINGVTKRDVRRLLKDFGIKSQFDIKQDAPVDTGNLKQQVNFTMLSPDAVMVESIALSEDNFDYAPVQEFGSARRSGKPYFYPNIKKQMVLMRSNLKRIIKKKFK